MTDPLVPPPEGSSPITRQSLADGTLIAEFRARMGAGSVLSEEERQARFAAMLAQAPVDQDVWVLAYGSMMWNPTVMYVEARPVVLEGWHRTFCLCSRAGRGCEENPGLMLAIEPGGRCEALAYRLPRERMRDELHLLWQREMVSGSYQAMWLVTRCLRSAGPAGATTTSPIADGGEIVALTFVADPQNKNYEADLSLQRQAQRIAKARGVLGSNLDYLLMTRQRLREHGLSDAYIEQLAAAAQQTGTGRSTPA
jgi:glutathione-specific gamma-glutamylcyclotransferase